ncbi:MAG: CRISPR system precrRNA processing endoribonuclease RAMP protein Cas6, partial [Ktedonobacteraceae bacterium]
MQTFLPSASLSTTHLWFSARTTTPLEIDAASGSAFRGSFFNAIWSRFCTNKEAPSCAVCPLHTLCPVSAIVAPLRDENARGQDIPRPYVIVPPLEGARRYQSGETFAFGMTLIGNIVQLLPYILLSLPTLEAGGLGHSLAENGGKRGHFHIEKVETYHPFTSERQSIYEEDKTRVQAPAITIHAEEWVQHAAQLNHAQITLRFVT